LPQKQPLKLPSKNSSKTTKKSFSEKTKVKIQPKKNPRPLSLLIDENVPKRLATEPTLNLNSFAQHLPSWGGLIKERGKSDISLSNTCTIDYFLYGLWLTIELDDQYHTLIDQNAKNKTNRIKETYKTIINIINKIESGLWPQAKLEWLNFVGLGLSRMEEGDISAFGTLTSLFADTMKNLQNHSIEKRCKHCKTKLGRSFKNYKELVFEEGRNELQI
jgi:hypothetical protein